MLAPATDVRAYKKAMKALANELASVKQQERQKIADDLHERVAQDLVVAKVKLGHVVNSWPVRYRKPLKAVHDLLDGAIKDIRSLIDGLCPEASYPADFSAALDWLARESKAKHGLACIVRIESRPQSLNEGVQLLLLQIARELLVNVVKHARAKKAEIVLDCDSASVIMQVIDDGQGFVAAQEGVPDLSIGRFGLFSARARLARIGGTLRIDSDIGAGTKAIVTVPLYARYSV
jgi:signal transduction histidine kinase